MSNEFTDRKKKWWNGFRDANTKEVLHYDIGVAQYGIPRGYRNININDIDVVNEKQLKVVNYMYDMINTSHAHRTMVVSGGNGTGKTFLGCAFIHAVALLDAVNDTRYHEPRYVYEGSLFRSLGGYGGESSFNFWTYKCGALVIDEFGMTQWTASDKKTMEQILNIRYSNDLPTILMTNRTSDEIFGPVNNGEPLFSSQLRSRYRGGYLVDMTGPDLRTILRDEEDDPDFDPFAGR